MSPEGGGEVAELVPVIMKPSRTGRKPQFHGSELRQHLKVEGKLHWGQNTPVLHDRSFSIPFRGS